jgi:hypothetical protein
MHAVLCFERNSREGGPPSGRLRYRRGDGERLDLVTGIVGSGRARAGEGAEPPDGTQPSLVMPSLVMPSLVMPTLVMIAKGGPWS